MMKRAATVFLIAALVRIAAGQTVAGEPSYLEPALSSRTDIVFYGGFEGDFANAAWKSAWGIPWDNRASEAQILTGGDGFVGERTLRVDYPAGGYGPNASGMQAPIQFQSISGMPRQTFDSLYLRYYVRFENGFDFKLGGKLPGLMGGDDSYRRSGGNQPDGTNGWTMRFMWRAGGEAVVYAYLPPGTYKEGDWGTDIRINRHFQPGTWHCIEQFVKVNTPGQANGKLYVWFDGERALALDDVTYLTVLNDAGRVGGIYFSTFHGGNSADWAPSVTSYARFDGFVAATKRIGRHDAAPPSLRVATTDLPSGMTGFAYDAALQAENGTQPYTWDVTTGTLPDGLSLSSAGHIAGTPLETGSFAVTVTVTDNAGSAASRELTLAIADGSSANLANQWTYLAHSENLALGNPIEGLWDNDISTDPAACPGSQEASSFWVEFDLQREYTLTAVRLYGDNEGSWVSRSYTVEARTAQSDPWTAIVDNADCSASRWYETSPNAQARFVKLTVIGDQAANTVQVREFEVLGEPSGSAVSMVPSRHDSDCQGLTIRAADRNNIVVSGLAVTGPAEATLYTLAGQRVAGAVRARSGMGRSISLRLPAARTAGRTYVVVVKDDEGHRHRALRVTVP